ncbi:MAG: hypothetical protein ERJ67_01800, partial [Aphanocapsa feldmannii 277cV]
MHDSLDSQPTTTRNPFVRLIQQLIVLAAALQMAPLPAQAQAIHRIGLPYNIFAGLFRLTDLHLDGSPDSSHGNAFPLNAASLTQAAPFNGTAHTPETPQGPASTAPALTTDLTDPTESILLAAIPEAETTSAFRFSPSEVTASASSFSGYGTTADNVPGLDMASPVLLAQAVPGKPTITSANPSFYNNEHTIWLTWTNPSNGCTGLHYRTQVGTAFRTLSSNCNISGFRISKDGSGNSLSDQTTYNIQIRGYNNHGNGSWSDSFAVVTSDGPAAPTGLAAQPRSASVQLSWNDPNDNSITKYQLKTSSSSNNGSFQDIPSSGSGGTNRTSYTRTYLTNDTKYTFTLRAVEGTNPGFHSTVTATPIPSPLAPQIDDNIGFGYRRIAITFDANPDEPNPQAILGYESAYKEYVNNNSNFNDSDFDDLQTYPSRTYYNLDHETEYVFAVRAKSNSGYSPISTITATAVATPDVPQDLDAASKDGKITLTWDKLRNQGVTKYHYAKSQNNVTHPADFDSADWSKISSSNGNTTSYTVTGLTNGTKYSFAVRAENGSGIGSGGSRTRQQKPQFNAPTGLSATAADSEVTLNWQALTTDSNQTITGYQYQQAEGTASFGSSWTDISDSDANTNTFVKTGLTNGTTYRFRIRAKNGKPGSAVSAKPLFASLTGLTATAGDTEVSLSWDDPNDSTISGYKLSLEGGTYSSISGSDATTTSHTVTGLTNGTTYSFAVRAENGKPPSSAVSAKPLFARLANLTATAGDTEVSLSWDNPNDSTISGYELSLDGDTYSSISGSDASTTSHTVTGLTNGTTY